MFRTHRTGLPLPGLGRTAEGAELVGIAASCERAATVSA